MRRKWKKKSSKRVYENPWIKIREDKVIRPDGQEGIYGFLEKAPGNFILAVDGSQNAFLVKEFRYPLKKEILQLPAGVVETEDELQQAKKELYEETGIRAAKWEKLGKFYVAPGHENTYINVFLATNLDVSKVKTDGQENDEAILEVLKVSLPEIKRMILTGEIECGLTIAALNLFFLKQFQ